MSCQNAVLHCSPKRTSILKIQLKVRPIQIYNSYLADAQEFGITDPVFKTIIELYKVFNVFSIEKPL